MPAASKHTLRELAGPELLAYFFNWALLGVLNVQVYLYNVTFPKDPLFLQILVYGMLAFEWIQTGLLTAGGFTIFVDHYGDVDELTNICYGWLALAIMVAVVSMVVQGFFAWRIYMLSNLRILVGLILTLSLVQGACGFISGVLLKSLVSTADVFSNDFILSVTVTWVAGSALVDIVIAVTMTILMLRRKTGVRETDVMVNKIIRLVVETGSLTAGCAILGLVLIVAFPRALYYEVPTFCMAKLYSNTFITNLLNRAYVTKSRWEQENRTVEHISLPFAHASRGTDSSHENGSTTGGLDRDALACPSQKALTPDKRSTVA